jgi:hypothetical protein
MYKNLAIIITGQLRTFFNHNDFTDMYLLSKKNYDNILVMCILNSDDFLIDSLKLTTYFNDLNCQNIIYNYNDYLEEYNEIIQNKLQSNLYLKQNEKYLICHRNAHIGLPDSSSYIKKHTCVQQHQIKLGIEFLLKYINENNCDFDIFMKTRFDSKYPTGFFPHITDNKDIIINLSFNEHNKNIITQNMTRFGINNIDELITFNKTNRIQPPNSHINFAHFALSFGGMVCYNYESLINIKNNGFNNILYAFNDFYYFSKKEDFVKLKNWIYESSINNCSNQDLYNHYFCPESQFLTFCLNNNINVLMYPECFYSNMSNR